MRKTSELKRCLPHKRFGTSSPGRGGTQALTAGVVNSRYRKKAPGLGWQDCEWAGGAGREVRGPRKDFGFPSKRLGTIRRVYQQATGTMMRHSGSLRALDHRLLAKPQPWFSKSESGPPQQWTVLGVLRPSVARQAWETLVFSLPTAPEHHHRNMLNVTQAKWCAETRSQSQFHPCHVCRALGVFKSVLQTHARGLVHGVTQ